MWWNKRYINRRDWILENLGVLELTSDQVLVVLMIDYMNEHHLSIDLESLSKRLAFDVEELDQIIHNLVRQNVLKISSKEGRFDFDINNIFESGLRYEYVDQSIFEVFESELARPLSQPELERLNTWLSRYTQEEIISALRSAIVYRKVNFQYINSILVNARKDKTP